MTEPAFLSPQEVKVGTKRKSPTPNMYPISCLNCFENSDAFIRADFDAKTVTCKKCNHIGKAEQYDAADFLKACLYDSKQGSGGSGAYKKHSETAYLSCLADCKRAENENAMILLKGKELELKKEEMDMKREEKAREDIEKSNRLQYELNLETTRQSTQQQMFKFQSEAAAAMQQMLTSVLPQKTPLEKYRERKASIAAMLSTGDITAEVAKSLMEKLDLELLQSNLI